MAVSADIYSQIRILPDLHLDAGPNIFFRQMDFYIHTELSCFVFDSISETDLIAGLDFLLAEYLLTVDKYFYGVIFEAFLKIDMND